MGDMKYGCPLCCKESFNTRQELVAHIANILENLSCPICNNKWSSVVHLLEHLSLDNCRPDTSDNLLTFEEITKLDNKEDNSTSKIMFGK